MKQFLNELKPVYKEKINTAKVESLLSFYKQLIQDPEVFPASLLPIRSIFSPNNFIRNMDRITSFLNGFIEDGFKLFNVNLIDFITNNDNRSNKIKKINREANTINESINKIKLLYNEIAKTFRNKERIYTFNPQFDDLDNSLSDLTSRIAVVEKIFGNIDKELGSILFP